MAHKHDHFLLSLTGGGTTTITINPTQNVEPGEVVSVAASGKSIIDTSLQTSTDYCYQFTTAASVAPKTFKKHALTGSGASVINNYSADINNDGFTDHIEVNSSAATSYNSISRGNGNGTFLTPTYIYTSATPYSTAIADYDLDGDMDIAIGYSAQYKVDIYYNNGTGSFTGPSNITTRYRARIVLPFYLLDNEAPSILCANTSDSALLAIRQLDSHSGSADKPLLFHGNRGASGIDGNISTAMGIAAVHGRVVALLGDLTCQHDLGGLALAQGRDAVIVAVNNGGGGIFDHLPQATLPEFAQAGRTPQRISFENAALTFGLAYAKADSDDSFRTALREAFLAGGPLLIEMAVG